MRETTKTSVDLQVNANGKFYFERLPGGEIRIGMGTNHFGPVSRYLTEAERLAIFEVIDVKRELAAGWEAINECRRLHEANTALGAKLAETKRVLRLLRDFTAHATQWVIGCRTHPIWPHIVKVLGPDNDVRPSKKEWAFLWPENSEPLGDGSDDVES